MKPQPQFGRTETPLNLLPAAEVSFTGAVPHSGVVYGRTQTPVQPLEPAAIDFAVPHLVLTLRLPAAAGAADPDALAVDVYDLIRALSDCEQAIGGRGLRLHEKQFDTDTITLALAPILVTEARARLDRLAELVADQNGRHSGSVSLGEAFDKAATSPAERWKIGLARRPWRIGVAVAA